MSLQIKELPGIFCPQPFNPLSQPFKRILSLLDFYPVENRKKSEFIKLYSQNTSSFMPLAKKFSKPNSILQIFTSYLLQRQELSLKIPTFLNLSIKTSGQNYNLQKHLTQLSIRSKRNF